VFGQQVQVFALRYRGASLKAADDETLGYLGHGKGDARRSGRSAGGGNPRYYLPGNAVGIKQCRLFAQCAVQRGIARVHSSHGAAIKGGGAHQGVALLKRQRGGIHNHGLRRGAGH